MTWTAIFNFSSVKPKSNDNRGWSLWFLSVNIYDPPNVYSVLSPFPPHYNSCATPPHAWLGWDSVYFTPGSVLYDFSGSSSSFAVFRKANEQKRIKTKKTSLCFKTSDFLCFKTVVLKQLVLKQIPTSKAILFVLSSWMPTHVVSAQGPVSGVSQCPK